MANKRVITSDMFSDDKFMFFDDFTRILWVGLITVCADDQGRFQNNEALIKSQVFPADKKSSSRVHKSLKELEEKGMVFFYEKDGKKLAQIPSWWKHQRPSWASPSLYTPPDGWVDREKYHSAGNKVVTVNWDATGGFIELHSEQDSQLHSPLPTGVSRLINEIKSEIKSESESDVDSFVAVYEQQTGLKPKKTKEEIGMVNRLIGLGVTAEEYRQAIQEMQVKPYKIASMCSPEKWVLNNHNGNKSGDTKGSYEYFKQLRKGAK